MSRYRLFVLISLIALVFLAACGGSSGESMTSTASGTAGETTVPAASGPVLPKASQEDGPAARGATAPTSDVAGVCLTPAEAELARLINEYRVSVGLPAVQVSKSLTLVAQQHAWDSTNNSNAWPAAPAGQECNMHSWSGNVNPALQEGTWTAVCYTDDHANMNGMHRKPREIAGYPADGYENSHWSSAGVSPAGALNGWQNSPGHNAVITEQNGWGPFLALGVGISGNYAHMWVGEVADPAGEATVCGGGAAAQPTAATEPTAAAQPTAESQPTAEAQPTVAATAPSTGGAATGEVLNQTGTVSGGGTDHTFEVAAGLTYSVVVTPTGNLDAALEYTCSTGNSRQSASIDSNWDGEAESYSYIAPANGTCTVTVSGYAGSEGDYSIVVSAR